jgi:hypothetical protein
MKTLLAVLALVTLGFGTVALTAPANASKTFLFPVHQDEGQNN